MITISFEDFKVQYETITGHVVSNYNEAAQTILKDIYSGLNQPTLELLGIVKVITIINMQVHSRFTMMKMLEATPALARTALVTGNAESILESIGAQLEAACYIADMKNTLCKG